jgi:hypothetical protein
MAAEYCERFWSFAKNQPNATATWTGLCKFIKLEIFLKLGHGPYTAAETIICRLDCSAP